MLVKCREWVSIVPALYNYEHSLGTPAWPHVRHVLIVTHTVKGGCGEERGSGSNNEAGDERQGAQAAGGLGICTLTRTGTNQ